ALTRLRLTEADHAGNVTACRKHAAHTTQHQRAHLTVGQQRAQVVYETLAHRVVDGVALLWSVDPQPGDVGRGSIEQDHGLAHWSDPFPANNGDRADVLRRLATEVVDQTGLGIGQLPSAG